MCAYVCVCVCGRFEVDSRSGVVTVGVSGDEDQSLLDAESTSELSLVIVATDPLRHHSTATALTIALSDVNDCRPLFNTGQQYVSVIAENSLVFTNPVTVQVLTLASSPPCCRPMCVVD